MEGVCSHLRVWIDRPSSLLLPHWQAKSMLSNLLVISEPKYSTSAGRVLISIFFQMFSQLCYYLKNSQVAPGCCEHDWVSVETALAND